MTSLKALPLDTRWKEALALSRRQAPEFYQANTEIEPGPHADAIRFALVDLAMAAVFCIEGVPTIGFLNESNYNPERIDNVHRILWNQGLMSLLLVIRDDELIAYSLVKRPLARREDLGDDAAQALLMQTMFVAYLEDRGIVTPEAFRETSRGACSNFQEMLAADSTVAFENLFGWLKQAFNGNVFNAPCAFDHDGVAPRCSREPGLGRTERSAARVGCFLRSGVRLGNLSRAPFPTAGRHGDTLRPAEDFMRTPEGAHYDAIIGNPPWKGRAGQVTTAQQWARRQELPVPAKDIAWGFIWKSPKVLKPDGIVGLLLVDLESGLGK